MGHSAAADCTASGQTRCISSESFVAAAPQSNMVGAANSISGTTTVTLTPTQGYWDGSKTVKITDSSLASSNIKKGTSIFGSNAAGRYVSSTLGQNVTPSLDVDNKTFVASIPMGWYLNGTYTCSIASTDDLIPSNIRSEKTIFGVGGSYSTTGAFSEYTLSNVYLNATTYPRATGRATLTDEINKTGNYTHWSGRKLSGIPKCRLRSRHER